MPPELQNPDDRNDLSGDKNLKLYNYMRERGKALDLTTLRVMTTCLSYSEFLTLVVMMWKILYSSKELRIVPHCEIKSSLRNIMELRLYCPVLGCLCITIFILTERHAWMYEIKTTLALYEKKILVSKDVKGKGSPEIQVMKLFNKYNGSSVRGTSHKKIKNESKLY